MDKNAIKKYAVWARRELIERVSQRALVYGITAKDAGDPNAESVNGHLLSQVEKRQRQALIRSIKEKGYDLVCEEVAYTWFNRFAALRFMEVNGYLPSHIRVFTNDAGEFKPQILAEAIHLELNGLDRNKVYALESANKSEELFKYLLIVQCNALNSILPGMFQRIEDYTELLLPDYLLREGSVIEQMVTAIPEADWTDQVQIIGWLYQYYNTELKDKVFADLKKNIKITKENIPAATQLFTPDWIVHYMVENSLGRLWLEGHPNDALKSEWKYYLDEAEQEPEVQAQLAAIRKEYAALKPEEIKVIDPCMGSGHILCVLFDVLVRIYEDYGYTAREAAVKIVEKNLWGLDIDERAAQLSYFAVMMKARQYDRRFFTRKVQPHVYSTTGDEEGENFGSLVMVDDPGKMPEDPQSMFDLPDYERRLKVWTYRHVLAQKYHVVVTNPPYMATNNLVAEISAPIKKNFPDEKADLFACFIDRCKRMTKNQGFQGMITQHAWMFLSSYEKAREKIKLVDTVNLLHLGPRAFEEIGGEVVQTSSFVFRKSHIKDYKGTYCRLIEPNTQQGKEEMFLASENRYMAQKDNFSKIPGSPVAYWASDAVKSAFTRGTLLSKVASPEQGMATADNARFVRRWYEPNINRVALKYDASKKWFPYNNGGGFRRWFGFNVDIVNWENNGAEIKVFPKAYVRNERDYFKKGITWNAITSSDISVRYFSDGFIFSNAGMAIFTDESKLYFILAFINSFVAKKILSAISPTLNYNAGDIANLPLLFDKARLSDIDRITDRCIELSKQDWDSYETSWDFTRHQLVRGASAVAEAYAAWEAECEDRFNQLKVNEEELNRIFIDIYGLQDELTPEVKDKDVTVRKADLGRDIRSLISYAVGCMFGRYSLDAPGLAYAGGEWDDSKYKTFQPDKDAILPICDDDYFEDDIMGRFVKWVETVYGTATLEENLQFIAGALGGKGSPREVIRNYFLNGFYADHCKIYQKRPIYWLFDSGKKNGFKCLIYMHRYQPDTIARIRTDYVHEQQSRYRTAIADLEQRMNAASTSERVKLSKRLATLQAQAEEIRVYEEKIHHLADQMIKIDLDDGVKRNYEIFKDVLAKIK